MFIVIAVALGIISLCGFGAARIASASEAELFLVDSLDIGSFAVFAIAFAYASPSLAGMF